MRTLFLTLRPPPSPPSLSPFSSPKPNHHRLHFLSPCSSLKQTNTKTTRLQKTTAAPPQSLKWLFSNPKSDDGAEIEKTGRGGVGGGGDDEGEGEFALKGTILAGLLLVGLVGGFGAAGYVYKDQVNAFLNQFTTLIEDPSDSSIDHVSWSSFWHSCWLNFSLYKRNGSFKGRQTDLRYEGCTARG